MQAPTSNGGRISRFRSAPPTWLETLLEGEEDDPLKSNHNLTQLLVAASTPSSRPSGSNELVEPGRFQMLNSSPAGFVGVGYLPSFGISKLDSSSSEVPLALKRRRSGQLPSTESGLTDVEMDRFLEDSIPCKVRAKRGCATHPRSIAERVRRTRISDRIRKLQELVPNMDKQTNTADMLEEAVEYVKYLQKQIQELSEHQRKCTCVRKE